MEDDIRKNINKFRDIDSDFKKWGRNLIKNGVTEPFVISEKTLNRLEKWIQEKEIAQITAFRFRLRHLTSNTYKDFQEGHKYTLEENRERNLQLRSALINNHKFGVIGGIYGSYIEGEKDSEQNVKEESYVVINLNDDPYFKDILIWLGEIFNQDSVLFKDKNSEEAYIVRTNANPDLPAFGEKLMVGSFFKNVSADFMSKLGNIGFAFGKKEDMTPYERKSFQDRKAERISKAEEKEKRSKENDELNEICVALNIETLDLYQPATRYFISKRSKPILEMLKKRQQEKDIL